MPNLPYSIELHDSEISAIEIVDGVATVRFSHAYIHKDGKGYSQRADLIISSATADITQEIFPAKVDDGEMLTKLGPYHNLLTIPLTTDGNVELKIEFQSGNYAKISGRGIDLVFTSKAEFIEDVTFT